MTKPETKRPRVDVYTADLAAPGLDPKRYRVGVHVVRRDGEPMTDVDLAACAAAFPRKPARATARKTASKRAAAKSSRAGKR